VARPRRPEDADPIDLLFHALGDPTRRRMVERLGTRPHTVTALAEACAISLTAVGQHVRILEDAGLVSSSKLGRVRSCQIEPAGLAMVVRWLAARRSTWDRRLDALGAIVERAEEGGG
jgi:DNA-binding transcriptional ArsR family regulator